ncbi:hypothetical protein [Mycolicibacterium holsaticum]|uniref:hypothetical protein n=1 Tax=Mycolicibacterium holsaticum TaxID=152142 RepID=UPI001E2D38B9|nr:hypothetical protein [Mycolicibacterium holsaticum]MDA4109120.1 hypothetical protein [Mycolicibacterium holsaticum DSM 44478 = JCM 12374]
MRRLTGLAFALTLLLVATNTTCEPIASAQPTVDEIAPPLPPVVVGPSDWTPKFPYPFDKTRSEVTDADINAMREMCQWYEAQYEPLITQIDRFNINLITSNGDYNVANNQQIADAVVANIDRSVAFLTPRAQALTQARNYVGDVHFPVYQGESFHLLWQHLSNVGAGIRGRQPAWFVGPSVQRVLRWGSRINRSQVCR